MKQLKKNIGGKNKMKIEKLDEKELFLRTQIGSGKIGKEEFSLCLTEGGGLLLVEFDETNEKYKVALQDIVQEVLKFRKKQK